MTELLLTAVLMLTGRVFLVVFAQYSQLGLETRRRRRLFGRTQTRFYCSKLPCSWLLDSDGKPLHDEVLQSGTSTLRCRYYH